MRAVLLSIKPKYCELIASGKKTIEVRKTIPKIERPFKCYIYCTKQGKQFFHGGIGEKECLFKNPDTGKIKFDYAFELMCCKNEYTKDNFLSGKVIGEFVCDKIVEHESEFWDDETYESIGYIDYDEEYGEREKYIFAENGEENTLCKHSCLTWNELREYIGKDIKTFYGWHITDLKIYDKPKELSEFYVEGDCDCMNCRICAWFDRGNGYVEDDCDLAYKGLSKGKSFKPIIRPPQSWCYVEDLGE